MAADQSDDMTTLIGVRPQVMAEAEHTFGNLFHRLHFCAEKLQARGVDGAATLEETISALEEILRLLLEYTCPLAVEFQPIAAEAVIGSAATKMGCTRPSFPDEAMDTMLTVDPSRLSQAFGLMSSCIGAGSRIEAAVEVTTENGEEGRWLRLGGVSECQPEDGGKAMAGREFVAWALAQKLIEAQGGALSDPPAADRTEWTLRLPLPQEEA